MAMSPKTTTDSSSALVEHEEQRERRPWDRMEGEPGAAFKKFIIYRDFGGERTLGHVAEHLGIKCNAPFQRAAARWRWRQRADAWDAHIAQRASERSEEKAVDALGRGIEALHELFATVSERLLDSVKRKDMKAMQQDLPLLKKLIGRQAPGRFLLEAHTALAGQRIINEGSAGGNAVPGNPTIYAQVAVLAAGAVAAHGHSAARRALQIIDSKKNGDSGNGKQHHP